MDITTPGLITGSGMERINKGEQSQTEFTFAD
jgi:hypothetical protein